jgi:hypothetical protein
VRLLSDISRCSFHLVSPSSSLLQFLEPKSWKRVFHDSDFVPRFVVNRSRKAERADNERVRAPSSSRKRVLVALSIGSFRPVSPISHSRAKDDQNDFCAAATATTGVKETGASIAPARARALYRLLSFRIFRPRLFSKRMALLRHQTGSLI